MSTSPIATIPNSLPATDVEFLSRKQLAQRWSCSVETIKRAEKRKGLRQVRIGPRTVRYHVADIIAIEEANKAK